MNEFEYILARQTAWALNRGLKLIGSAGNRGREIYTKSLDENLFQPLNHETKCEIEDGDGGELTSNDGRPAKMQALHSSSTLAANVFDYWRSASDLSPLTSACGLVRTQGQITGTIRFEQKFPIDDRFKIAPNLDVVIYPAEPNDYEALAIESKFTEAYSSTSHGGIKDKYLTNDEIWTGLSALKQLAIEISPDDNCFTCLHAAQLIKHILGLNRTFGHSKYRILYLWYDALGKAGALHREEVDRFNRIASSDGVVFHAMTYQELLLKLAEHRDSHGSYVEYLTSRYL